jgi:hypothetical protein
MEFVRGSCTTGPTIFYARSTGEFACMGANLTGPVSMLFHTLAQALKRPKTGKIFASRLEQPPGICSG